MPPASPAALGARRAAFRILQGVRRGQPFDRARDIGVADVTDERDRRLAHELAAGVLRQQAVLDAALAPRIAHGWNTVTPSLQDVLRLGAYQLTQLDRIPVHAAVDTSVSLAREVAGDRAAGFVNAVLRKIAAAPAAAVPPAETAEALAAAWSHPEWLVRRWVARFGTAGTIRLLEWNNTRPALVVQPARAEPEELHRRWSDAGIRVAAAPLGAGLRVDRRPTDLPGFAEGDFVVQDPAHALVVRFSGITGGLVYDMCAAPGGKSVALGRAGARVIAGDRNREKVARLADTLHRAGSGREYPIVADGLRPPLGELDGVLLDAPCLGTGTLARHPDARWRITPESLDSLVDLQARLLESAARLVRPGGALVFATCSLEPEENECQVESFLNAHPEFRREPAASLPQELLTPAGDLLILPQRAEMDGAYAARLRRSAP
ncbi:MAG: RsmB/NOP family class I SAM-dependent RNA methyltransferase [Gemmatimonadales bacterium]